MVGWGLLARLCLVNAAIGGLAALPVNLFNRLMTVELALPALLPIQRFWRRPHRPPKTQDCRQSMLSKSTRFLDFLMVLRR